MDILALFPTEPLPTFFALLFLVLTSLLWASTRILRNPARTKKKAAAPEAGGAWPVIGHLHLLGGPTPAHIVLGKMADKYGPIFTIKTGVHRALVVSNWEMAKECLTTNDRAFANRPRSLATDLLGYDRAMIGFSPYGSYWRQVRKIATLELLSNRRLEMLQDVRQGEVRKAARELYKLWEKNKNSDDTALVEMERWFGDITLNVILKMIVGKSVGYMTAADGGRDDEGWKEALKLFFDLSGRFVVADALPFLRWLDIGGHETAMKKTAEELDIVVETWLKEKKTKRESEAQAVKGDGDFMDVMLNVLNDDELGRDSDTVNKATALNLSLAASDTTTVTLCWALSLLVNHPHILEKTQLELDNYVGREKQVEESDLVNLVYLKAVIKETMRLYPAGPLSVPHESMEDTTVGDYHISTGTRLLINLWKLHRDPRVWSDPDEFQPERFLTTQKEFDFRGQNFEFIPFGSGRRMCPGVTFAQQALELTLATLLHGFHFAASSAEPLDMSESIGLTNPRATPLEVLINPRLPSHLYV